MYLARGSEKKKKESRNIGDNMNRKVVSRATHFTLS